MAAEATPRLRVRGVTVRFGPTTALAAVDLDVAGGEVHAVIGENGAGKSTLMKVLSGAVAPDAGELWIDGTPYRPASPLDAANRGIAMVYQELSLVPHLGAAENIVLGREPLRRGLLDRRETRARARAALAALGHADLDPDLPVRRLPPAVQQIVEIARALRSSGTRVLVLDEPTSSLAADDVERLFETIGRLRAGGLSIIYISHVLEEVRRVADRFTVLRDGRTVGAGRVADVSTPALISMMAGREVTQIFPRSARHPGKPLLELRDLAGSPKPSSASLVLHAGEVLGIGGLVGSGRSELLRVVFGLEPVRRGVIRVGAAWGPASPWQRLAQGAGMLSEDRKREGLAQALSIADNLTLSRLAGLGPGRLVTRGRQAEAARHWMEALSIRAAGPHQVVGELSGGNQQKVALARLLHDEVDVLLLDEPTRGIDVGSKAEIYQLIDRLALQGKAVLLVSSYLPELLGTCDRVAVMTRGVLGPARPASELSEHQLLTEAVGEA
ncbi:MAG: sugar ABC transporter ATP-binding protein [Acidobacteria bacterium]|nr:MAG: sugar ABC transporter ATP-binding protein [Acidobacteriota bacterium]